MKRILDIGHNDLRIFLKNRAAYVWLFLMPLGFIVGISFIRYGSGATSNRFPPVLVENNDKGFLGGVLIDVVSAQGLWRLDPAKNRDVKPACALRIPEDFSARVLAKKSVKVEYLALEGSNPADAMIVQTRLLRALVTVNSNLIEAATAPGSVWPPTEEALKAIRERADPVSLDAKYVNAKAVPTGINFSLPGNLVNFLMLNLLIFGGATVAATRRSGVLRRLLTLPVRRGELVAGQIYGVWLLGVVQIVFFLLVGRFAFHMNLGANLPGVALVLLMFAWVAAALGVLVGSILDAHDRVIGICVFASMMMAAVSGCWFPLEVVPAAMQPTVQTVAHCVPSGWTLEALHQLISFGHGTSAVVKPVLVLAGFGVAATAAAARWFRV